MSAPETEQQKKSANDAQNDVQGNKWVRKQAVFRSFIVDAPDAEFPPEKDRYHLFFAHGCPWSSGTLIVLHLKKLEGVIGHTAFHHTRLAERGWKLAKEEEYGDWPEHLRPSLLNPVNGCRNARDLYELSDPEYEGRWTLPILWDKKTNRIVSNESIEIIRMMDTCFDKFITEPTPRLFPKELVDTEEWQSVMQRLYREVNDGPYKCGFAPSQEGYEEAAYALFDALDMFDDRLSKNRFVFGSSMTLADIRLFSTLIRFDRIYHQHFKCNLKHIYEYKYLHEYMLEIYQMPTVCALIPLEVVRKTYYNNHQTVDPKCILPIGPKIDLDRPHKRDEQVPV